MPEDNRPPSMNAKRLTRAQVLIVCAACLVLLGCVAVGIGIFLLDAGGFGFQFRHGATLKGVNPVLDPDGLGMVYARPRPHRWEIVRIAPLEAGTEQTLRESESFLGFVDLSADRSQMVYVSEEFGPSAICIADATGANARRLTHSSFAEHTPRFSADGKRVAFARRMSRTSDNRAATELFVIDSDGQSERRLTDDRCVDQPIRFNQRGTELYFASERNWDAPGKSSSTAHVFSISLTTLSITVIAPLELRSAGGCDISQDERTIAFIDAPPGSYAYDVFVCDLDGSSRRRASHLSSYIGDVRFGFHSDRFSFVEQSGGYGAPRLYAYDLPTDTTVRVNRRK